MMFCSNSTIALSRVVSVILHVEKYRDFEIPFQQSIKVEVIESGIIR